MHRLVRNLTLAVMPLLAAAFALSACAGARPAGKPERAPFFTVELVNGGTKALADYSGRPLMLNIGASWCPHCIHELPALSEAHKKYGDRVGFLVVFVKSEREDVAVLVREHRLGFDVGYDKESAVGKAYGVKGIPVSVFIDADGNITGRYLGSITERELAGRLDEMLAPPAKGK